MLILWYVKALFDLYTGIFFPIPFYKAGTMFINHMHVLYMLE